MNETLAIAIWTLGVIAFIVIAVRWFLAEYKEDDYIKPKKQIFDDFYTLGKRSKD